jgi:hypothetical protein
MKMERTECSETMAFKLQTPGNNPKENIRHSKHGESLKSRISGCLPSRVNKNRFFVMWPDASKKAAL